MSLENAKRLLKHYQELGRKDLADNLIKNRPELKPVPKKPSKKNKV